MKRVFRPYTEWEETAAGLWTRPTGEERQRLIRECREFMADTDAFRAAMERAIQEWPVSCEVNLTSSGTNRRAWLGHAACCIAIGCPEEPTRAAWWLLTDEQRLAGDEAATATIELWEASYRAQA